MSPLNCTELIEEANQFRNDGKDSFLKVARYEGTTTIKHLRTLMIRDLFIPSIIGYFPGNVNDFHER